jgi:hypothetical protein
MIIQYIIVLLIVAWAVLITIRNLISVVKPAAEGSSCAGCKGCALKTPGPDIPKGKIIPIKKP